MLSSLFVSALALFGASYATPLIKRASLQQVTNFGDNASKTLMYIYVPAKLAAKPPIIVAIHYCSGTASAYYQNSPYASLADQYGFIVIYPESPYSGTCWDVSSVSALTHNGGGDSNSIANMVTYTLKQYSGDASKVFVTGTSSGAMMTNVMAATYPEMFAAATAYSGVPAGCFVSTSGGVAAWNSTCSQGQAISTPAYWASVVENMDKGYTGPRPRFQVYHGSVDATLLPQNYNETVKQWTGVFGYNYLVPDSRTFNFPQSGYTTDKWGVSADNPVGKVQGIYAIGVGHTVPINGTQDMQWFGLGPYASGSAPAPPAGSTTTSAAAPPPATTTTKPAMTSATLPPPVTTTSKAPAPPPATTTAAAAGGSIAKYGQCGGKTWTGSGTCVAGTTCKVANDYYSQCL